MKFIKALSRKTSSNNFIPEIDGLRFLAIFTVVLYHLNTAYSKEIGIGLSGALEQMGDSKNTFTMAWWWVRLDLGVKVFFAISGFVLALPFLRFYLGKTDRKVELRGYFLRRLTRLEPPFILSLVVFYIVHLLVFNADGVDYLYHLLAGIVYGHVFIYGEPNPINPVSWSLETEAQFYLIVPFILWIVFRFQNKWVSGLLMLVFLVFSVWFKHDFIWNDYWNRSIPSFFINFAMGIIACWVYLENLDWIKRKSIVYDVVGLLSMFGLFYFYKPQHYIFNIVPFNFSLVIVLITAFKSYLFNWIYTRKIIYTIGGMCYSIYLLHFAFFHLSVKYTKAFWVLDWSYSANLGVQIMLSLPLMLGVSTLFFVWFEKPFMDRDWWGKFYKKIIISKR
jgi:peptidoglycan/LPS O-acetylase OafA/YrhL